MRLSCNGCRVLRKGCSDTCIIRPCLDCLPSPESPSNATLFLAKFYGRAGLLNLINAGPSQHRPAIFKSLLYEACGRIVNPVHGSAGLLWTGRWNLCQAAVDDALKGSPIKPISAADDQSTASAFKACDIRHVSKSGDVVDHTSNSLSDLHMAPLKPVRQTRFKRIGLKGKATKPKPSELLNAKSGSSGDGSALSHNAPSQSVGADGDVVDDRARIELDLTLGRGPAQKEETSGPDEAASEADLGLGLGLGCWH